MFKTITVIGANGSMGRNISAIFASFGNAKVYMVCRSLEKAEKAAELAALSVKANVIIKNLIPADYDSLPKCIAASDLVFESVAEDIEIKNKINKIISENISETATICTGTSGLSITSLALNLSENQRTRYLGMHFFNPPYNMPLCEVIPTQYTSNTTIEQILNYATNTLYRIAVKLNDTPAFLGNRIGFYFINHALSLAAKYAEKGGIDYIDAILGQFSGRAMAPLVTADFVGLDIHEAIVNNLFENTDDYVNKSFELAEYAKELIAQNKLGRKTGEGLYKSEIDKLTGKKSLYVYDIASKKYRPLKQYKFTFKKSMIEALRVGKYNEASEILLNDSSEEANICLEALVSYVLYSAFCSSATGTVINSADDVMASGFNWAPPLSVVDFLGGANKFSSLLNERFVSILNIVPDFAHLLTTFKSSSYDYRRYFRAKK